MDFFSKRRRPNKSRKSARATGGSTSSTSKPGLEPLEDRMLLSGSVISGYVFTDSNNNGIFDPGETPLANVNLQLHNSSNQLVATAVSDSTGYYQFNNDNTVNTNPTVLDQTVTIPTTLAGFDLSKAINQFDPSLGQLLEVDVIHSGSITSDIRAENTSTLSGANITGTVSGSMTLTGGGVTLNTTVSDNAGNFNASAFDGSIDFSGNSGRDFGPQTANAATKSVTLTGSQMNPFIGTGQLTFDENVVVNSTATGGGNLTANITSNAAATYTVRYKYIPSNALKPGNYTITETQPANYFDGKESQQGVVIPNSIGTDTIPVTIAPTTQTLPHNDFGELQPANLAGHVYFDANNNGTLDSTEQGIAATTVTLTGTDYTGQAVNVSTTTAADGSYGFINVKPGNYTLTETQPGGYLQGKNSVGSLGGTITADQFNGINAGSGANGVNYNFGELRPASLAGFVYDDVNDNGVMDQGETGIAGVTVTLTGTSDQGPVSQTVQTAADGSYQFNNLRPGTYTIAETQPANYLDGKDAIGTQGGTAGNDQFSNIALASGVKGISNNFGELLPASLAGFVYDDANNNGVMDPGEQGLTGVAVNLTGTDDNGQSVTRTATTAADGSYKFSNLRPGNYALHENQPGSYLDGKDAVGSQGGVMSNDLINGINLSQNTNGVNNNFGELLPASVAGFVYADANQNGVKDPGEPAIAGVAMTLTGTDDLGAVTHTTTTAADGSYSFNNLRPGVYTIQETQPTGYQQGTNTVGSLGGSIAGDQFSSVALQQSQHGTDYDFGEISPTGLSGHVYHDTNNNGVIDAGEVGIGGVLLTLTGTTASGTAVNLQTTTAADGSYAFTGLQPGTYSIQETQPASWLQGKNSVGSTGGTMTADNFAGISLPLGALGANYNFGELKPGSLAGHVYQDDNNNGTQDPGEVGIGGVSVKLTGTDYTGKAVSATTTTAADGSYEFDNLTPGSYALAETQPTGYADGKDTVGSLGGAMTNDHFNGIAVGDSQAGANYNFGERIAADVAITKSVTPSTALPGATLTYTLTITNNGPSTAQNVQVVDSLPAGETFVTAAAAGWALGLNGSNVTFSMASLAPGATSSITITAVAPLTAGTYNNVATVSTSTLDTNPNNNQAQATVKVQPTPTQAEDPVCHTVINSYDTFWLAALKKNLGM